MWTAIPTALPALFTDQNRLSWWQVKTKIVPDLASAVNRVKQQAAPSNTVRLHIKYAVCRNRAVYQPRRKFAGTLRRVPHPGRTLL